MSKVVRFIIGEVPCLTGKQFSQIQWSELNTFQSNHGMANVVKHAFDLMLAPLVDGDFNPGIGLSFSSLFHFGRSCLAIF
jgi:hypothetical protein